MEKLNAAQRDSQEKDQKCSKLENDNYDMQKKMAEARRARQEEIKRLEALKKKQRKQMIEILIAIAIVLGLVPIAIGLVVWWATS